MFWQSSKFQLILIYKKSLKKLVLCNSVTGNVTVELSSFSDLCCDFFLPNGNPWGIVHLFHFCGPTGGNRSPEPTFPEDGS